MDISIVAIFSEDLTNNFVIHKTNVLDIKKENFNWPMAFRYNIAIRTMVMTVQNANGKLANPGVRNKQFERMAFRNTERFGDFVPAFNDVNPYADGCVKATFNPITGEDLHSLMHSQKLVNGSAINVNGTNLHIANNPFSASLINMTSNALSKPNAQSWAHANQPIYDGPGGMLYGSWDDCRGGGRNVCSRGRGGNWSNNSGQDHSPPLVDSMIILAEAKVTDCGVVMTDEMTVILMTATTTVGSAITAMGRQSKPLTRTVVFIMC
ncbi:uncharacterized protein MELLADRAFT_87011 [Melampsora larici-populina 98AG31]|uniref:Uncharacterized protein n=1 Tax=Melampsora larici-populina (strain 98AG31 / pathotype 3-4-7) TaxID=747676 RepID=F4R471_MELLP|nr:uncharacterized protein MELLADRAFT_87011 [Melampsora larici-populina 98AG31]EGG13045.1 hypothetical protein MELLADRAFT_87011 [Melampsora larici-populina 98AG31]